MNIVIKHIESEDWEAIINIYQLGIATGVATFETEIPSWSTWNVSHLQTCRLAAWMDSAIIGWAALSPVSTRCVYKGVAEVSVYINPRYRRKGIGTQLLKRLIIESEQAGIWTLQSGIFSENKASIQLHKKVGFREIGYREKIGKRKGVWYNNIILERRSKQIGID